MPAADWTPERVEALHALWGEGLSAAQIARRLGGVTRNAVIGKAYRLGLSGRVQAGRPRAAAPGPIEPKRPGRAARAAAPVRLRAAARITPEAPGSATVLSAGRGACRWPIGDPLDAGFTYCGAPAVRGAYCAGHGAIAYRSRSPEVKGLDRRVGGRRRRAAGD